MYARVQNDTIVEMWDSLPVLHPELMSTVVEVPNNVQVGWIKNGDNWEVPIVTTVSVYRLSARQLIIGAAKRGWISSLEAKVWASGNDLPSLVKNAILILPSEHRLAAEITALKMTEVMKTDPLLLTIASMLGLSSNDIDTFFQEASTL